ncbi:MAG TPA: hypothetical protein VN812_16885, partial [Candidatus Acidoferrales bacterium]|nr:hypothetical protein [Candidatus Acidoferrales bacterium]
TSPQTITGLITSTTDSGGKPEGFFMAALGGSAIDTAYVVDESLGIQKWSLVMGNWTLNNAIAQPASDQIYDIAGVVNGSSVTLYATGSTSNNDAGTLYSLSDTSGFNGSINGSLSLLVTASANKTFRGAALAPVSAATPTPSPTPTGFFNTPTRTPTIITPTPTLTPTKTLSPTRTPTGTKTPTAGPFTFGNVVAYRIGDGTATLVSGNGFPVFLDEYMISGSTATLKQSVPLPVTVKGSNQPLVASGTAGTEGQLTLSANGQYLMLTGYDAAVGTAGLNSSTSDVVARTVGRVDFNGIVNTTTALADFCSGDKPRSATSDGGTNIWLTCGANATGSSVGVHYATLGGTTSTQLSADIIDSRQVNIFGGQLYVSSQDSSGILFGTVGSGAPTSAGQSITALPGIDTTTDMAKNPDGFFMTALGGAGIDTLYVADTKDGIQKWSLVSGTWNLNNSVSASPDVLYGVTGTVNGTTVTLYATGSGSNNIEGTLYGLIDSSGFNGMMSGTLTSLATLPPNETFRGVALAPGAPTPGPSPTPPATPTKTASPTRTPTPAAFTAGNIVVYRVGNGSGALHRGVGFPVFLDEYTPGGTLVQSVGMPITDSGASHALIASASAGTEGQLTVSANGQYLLLTGYDAAVGAANLSSTTSDTVARTVGRVKYTGAVDTSTALTDFASGDKPRSAASDNGTNIWLSGGGKAIGTTGGIHYTTLGSTTSTQISSTYGDGRQVNVFGNQLYVSSQDTSIDFIGTVGSGLQTTGGQTMTPLPGFEMTGAPESFFMASLGGSGIDTLYVADDSAGIQKWSLVGGSWTLNNTIAPSADQLYGVAGSVSGTTVTLYATGSGSANTAGTL